MVVNYYLVSLNIKFLEDPCINARTRVVNARAHVLLGVCAFTTHSRALNANISTTKAQIFIKFYVVVNYELVIICIKFHSDLCINARAQVVNAGNRDKTCARVFTTRVRIFMHRSA